MQNSSPFWAVWCLNIPSFLYLRIIVWTDEDILKYLEIIPKDESDMCSFTTLNFLVDFVKQESCVALKHTQRRAII